jgi:hypothetical protein
MIIEYLGLPGSGKSYQASILKQKLGKEEKKFLDISRYSNMPIFLKFFYKFADLIVLLCPNYRKLYHKYLENCDGALTPLFVPLTLDYCIRDILLAHFLHKVFANSNKTIIIDEGGLHRITFLATNFNISIERIMSIYESEKQASYTIMVDTSIDRALDNITLRNRHTCLMDELPPHILLKYLNTFQAKCQQIIHYCNKLKYPLKIIK